MRSHKWRHTTVTHHQLYGSKTWRYSGTYSEGVTDKYGVLYVRRGVCAAVKEPTCKWQARKKQDLPFLACSVPKLERNSFAIDTQILHLKIDSWNKKLVRTRNESACSETSFFDKRKKLQIINNFELIMHWQKLNLLYLIAIFPSNLQTNHVCDSYTYLVLSSKRYGICCDRVWEWSSIYRLRRLRLKPVCTCALAHCSLMSTPVKHIDQLYNSLKGTWEPSFR